MFGFFSASRRESPATPIVEHPDFMEISRIPAARPRQPDIETAFQRDYGSHRTVTETAARLA